LPRPRLDALVGAKAASVLLEAEEAKKHAGIVNDSQPAPPSLEQRGGRSMKQVRWGGRAADERAEFRDRCGTSGGCREIQPLDRCEQQPIWGHD
jgi:hypothetical protein